MAVLMEHGTRGPLRDSLSFRNLRTFVAREAVVLPSLGFACPFVYGRYMSRRELEALRCSRGRLGNAIWLS